MANTNPQNDTPNDGKTIFHATNDVKTELQTMYKIIMNGRGNCTLSKKNSVLEMVQCNTKLMLDVFKEMSERMKDMEASQRLFNDLVGEDEHFRRLILFNGSLREENKRLKEEIQNLKM